MIMIKTLQFIFQTPNFWLVWKKISPVVYFLWIPIFKNSLICILKGNENLQRTSAHCNMWWIDFTVMYVYVLPGWLHYIYVHVQSMKRHQNWPSMQNNIIYDMMINFYSDPTPTYILMMFVTYRFMNEIIVTNESEWAEHMYRVGGRSICTWCLHIMYSLCYFVSLALEF